ncbi:MAG TPA: 7,8-didemethyl-8-hydroxy-5-deazariboflavin synthase CofG [Clostridia bacterium]|nr:7,8-didemethyl-8-hydroxy-5-deazariboflavin synthase CofG [Clostridia bacterium]
MLLSLVREVRKPVVTFSRNVALSLSRLCRNACTYCNFRRVEVLKADDAIVNSAGLWNKTATIDQRPPERGLLLTPEEAISIAREGARVGCKEALIISGERPEARYESYNNVLKRYGCKSTVEYAASIARAITQEVNILPHTNVGVLGQDEVFELKEVNASLGLMIETSSFATCLEGGPHRYSPGKLPCLRYRTLFFAGKAKVPFTTGILVGIGETWRDRLESLFLIRDLHERYGHIQEVIIQGVKGSPDLEPDASFSDIMATVSLARLILPNEVAVQTAPNLIEGRYGEALNAGVDDWGGISPISSDEVNPEYPWPDVKILSEVTEKAGFRLRERLPVYPRLAREKEFVSSRIARIIESLGDDEGYARSYPFD